MGILCPSYISKRYFDFPGDNSKEACTPDPIWELGSMISFSHLRGNKIVN
ncbi:hypothetical protein KKD49_19600 [Myxococcota bacterium]|nr:hypothetical protein [Myxococcota bacterium]